MRWPSVVFDSEAGSATLICHVVECLLVADGAGKIDHEQVKLLLLAIGFSRDIVVHSACHGASVDPLGISVNTGHP